MRRKLVATTMMMLFLASIAFVAMPIEAKPINGPKPGTDFNGPHYNLNIIGRKSIGSGGYDNPDRHTMFVPLEGDTTITMTLGSEFAVIDGNGFDENGVTLQMPSGEGVKFNVYLVSLGKPSDGSTINYPDAWIYDPITGLWYYNLGTVIVKGHSKQPQWQDVTDVFWVEYYVDGVPVWQGWLWQVPQDLFEQTGYFWTYQGADKLLQVRFYPA